MFLKNPIFQNVISLCDCPHMKEQRYFPNNYKEIVKSYFSETIQHKSSSLSSNPAIKEKVIHLQFGMLASYATFIFYACTLLIHLSLRSCSLAPAELSLKRM